MHDILSTVPETETTGVTQSKRRPDDRSWLWLCLIVLLGFGIRLTGLFWGQGYCWFGAGDGVSAYDTAVDYGRGDPTAAYLAQPCYNSASKLPGPLWSIFCLATMRAWGSIEGTVLALLLLNTAVIGLTYLLGKRTLGRNSALWAALLAATLPFPVYYSTFLYNPNVMPFLGALLCLALWDVTQRERSRAIFWVSSLMLLSFQFHMSGLALLPAIIILIAISSTRLNVRWLLFGVVAGGLLYVPYLRGEMAHGWHNTLGMTTGRTANSWGGLKALTAPLNLLVNYVPQWTHSFDEYRELGKACFGWFGVLVVVNLLSAVVAIALLAGAVQKVRAAMQGSWRAPREVFARSPGPLFLAVVVTVPLLCSAAARQSFHSRYSIVLLPALLALAGGAVMHWLSSRRWARLFLAEVIVTTCANIWFMPAMYHAQGARIEQSETFYASLPNLEAVYQRLRAHAGPGESVEVDVAAYLKGLAPHDKAHRDAELIRRYVMVREKERAALYGVGNAPVTYALFGEDQVTSGDRAIAYVGHGIALMAQKTRDTST
jgi:hypothetical protein